MNENLLMIDRTQLFNQLLAKLKGCLIVSHHNERIDIDPHKLMQLVDQIFKEAEAATEAAILRIHGDEDEDELAQTKGSR